MGGYIIAAVMIGPIKGTDTCYGILCWRWPLLVEWFMLVPVAIAIHFVPENHLVMGNNKDTEVSSERKLSIQISEPLESDLENDNILDPLDQDEKSELYLGFENDELKYDTLNSNLKTVLIFIF